MKSTPLEFHSDSSRDALDALSPDVLVDGRVQNDLGGAHGLLGELTDDLHGSWGALLEGAGEK